MARPDPPPVRGLARASGAAAVRIIVEPYTREREGWRHLFLGDSGQGKSYANRALLRAAAHELGAVVVAHDDSKREPQYEGALRAHPDDLDSRPITEEEETSGAIIFRGDPYAGRVVEVEDVATLALKLARAGVPTVLAVDELDRAVTPGGQQLVALSLRTALTQGRALGLSVASTTQNPARAPKEVVDQATTVGLFRLGPRAISYLDDRLYFDSELLEVIETLERGDFVLHRPGYQWDRTLYRFP